MHHLTMTTDGRISDLAGNVVAHLSDTSQIGDFLLGYRAGHGPVDGSIIRWDDILAWEAATVARREIPQSVRRQARYLRGQNPI